jgi:hypothetical protein
MAVTTARAAHERARWSRISELYATAVMAATLPVAALELEPELVHGVNRRLILAIWAALFCSLVRAELWRHIWSRRARAGGSRPWTSSS